MATMEEMARFEAAVAQAEADALRALAKHLREAVIDLPVESRLARTFAGASKKFDQWSEHRGHEAEMGHIELSHLLRNLRKEA